jgi:hypothetical protein
MQSFLKGAFHKKILLKPLSLLVNYPKNLGANQCNNLSTRLKKRARSPKKGPRHFNHGTKNHYIK